MKRYIRIIKENQKYKYIAYRDIINYKYSSIKPYREYLIETPDTSVKENGGMICFNNVKIYTKEKYKNKKISNKMIFVDVKNTCIDRKKDGWIFETGEINI